ncbi:hypothetical protein BST96_00275 [Oceanicoccus sagamiensis]|uniref:Uncharacterized protein n=1 Tax=Oceanicoccus sagamiensis TaxID=716816 RepID=A0A1X9NF79_9GAMM|nr:hypothetical protein BST96_00275 [Oceanicoccus sagamiensis]
MLLACQSLLAYETFNFGQYALQAKSLDTEVVGTEKDELAKAQFNSGLGLAMSNSLFDINVDYLFKGHVEDAGDNDKGDLSQALSASMRSALLNDLLAVDANIQADSLIDVAGNAYHYAVTPGFSRSFYNLFDMDMAYNYRLVKPSDIHLLEETKGYSVGLNGSMDQGRLVWQGKYSDSDMFRDQALDVETTRLFDFTSSYRLIEDLSLELKGLIKNLTQFDNGSNQTENEKHFGAGFLWSPSEKYSFSLNLNQVNKSTDGNQDIFGGGKITWSPKPDLDLSLGYGDDLQDGSRGLMFSTKLDLDKI